LKISLPSALNISERKRQLNSELYTHLYFSEKQRKIIIVPVYIVGSGVLCEQDTSIVLPFDSLVDDIGRQAKESLLNCEKREMDLTSNKLTDWPAYKASKVKSVKLFQTQYVHLRLQTINANLQIEGVPIGSKHIFVGAYIAPGSSNADLGELLFQVYRCCVQLTQARLL
jgi:hypothetical protein